MKGRRFKNAMGSQAADFWVWRKSDQFPFFFLEGIARPSFMEQALPYRSHLPPACWRVSLPSKAIPIDLWNLRQEIPFSTAFSNEKDCQNTFLENYRTPAQELVEKVQHLHEYNAPSSSLCVTRAALMHIYTKAS